MDHITMITVQEQAKQFMIEIQTRRRAPVKAATVKAYQSHIYKHILPMLGDRDLVQVENGVVKSFIKHLSVCLKPATVNSIFMTLKMVMASAVDENGNQLYPRTWNADFIDLPVVVPSEQDAPTVTSEAIQEAIRRVSGPDKALYALLAGTGLRIGEALTLGTGPDNGRGSFWIPEFGTLIIRSTISGGKIQESTKTLAGNRQVDLHPELNTFLCHLLLSCKLPRYGFLFPSQTGGLACIKTCYQRLAKAGITEGFHAFRRFRITHLESLNCPPGLQRFWTGHGARDTHESYIKMSEQIATRKSWCEKVGLGFELPRD